MQFQRDRSKQKLATFPQRRERIPLLKNLNQNRNTPEALCKIYNIQFHNKIGIKTVYKSKRYRLYFKQLASSHFSFV